jgi:branched-chain amino acid transport system substrate-binding protein
MPLHRPIGRLRRLRRLCAALPVSVALLSAATCDADRPATVALIGINSVAHADTTAFLRGVLLALDSLNRTAPPGAPRIDLRMATAGAASVLDVAAAHRDDPSVVATLGPERSQTVFDVIPVLADEAGNGAHAVPTLTALASSPGLSGRSAWLFRLCPRHDSTAAAAGRAAADSLHARTAVLVYRADVGGREWERGFSLAFASRGGRIIHRLPQLDSVTSWPRYAALIARLQPDVIAFAGGSREAALFLRELDAQKVATPVIGTEEIADLGARAVRQNGGAVWFTDIYPGGAGIGDSALVQRAVAFAAAFRQRHGETPDLIAAHGYDAGMLVGSAIQAAGPSRAGVRAYLETLGGSAPALPGVTGMVAFDAAHDRTTPTFAVRRLTP